MTAWVNPGQGLARQVYQQDTQASLPKRETEVKDLSWVRRDERGPSLSVLEGGAGWWGHLHHRLGSGW